MPMTEQYDHFVEVDSLELEKLKMSLPQVIILFFIYLTVPRLRENQS